MTDAEHLISRVVAAWNSHDPGAITALHAPESTVTDVGIGPPARGSDDIRARAQMFIDGIGDLRVSAGLAVGIPEFVAYEWHVTGSHAGDLLGVASTGRLIDVPGATVFELDGDGMIIAERLYWNVATLMEQIGAGGSSKHNSEGRTNVI
jgi:steroid delta-isomerase-like uncharacterized protein